MKNTGLELRCYSGFCYSKSTVCTQRSFSGIPSWDYEVNWYPNICTYQPPHLEGLKPHEELILGPEETDAKHEPLTANRKNASLLAFAVAIICIILLPLLYLSLPLHWFHRNMVRHLTHRKKVQND